MRQVAGDVSATKSAKPTAKNDRGQKKPTSKIDKPEQSIEVGRKEKPRKDQVEIDEVKS